MSHKLEFGPGPMEVHHTCLERLAALEAERYAAIKDRDDWKEKSDASTDALDHFGHTKEVSRIAERIATLEAENAELRKTNQWLWNENAAVSYYAANHCCTAPRTSQAMADTMKYKARIAENERMRVKLDSMPEHKRTRECHYKAPCLECEAQDVRDDLRAAMEDHQQ